MEETRVCEICQSPLDPLRVKYCPQTRLCVDHARQAEQRYGGEFLRVVSRNRLSKEQSLKKNYGDVNVTFVENTKGLRQLRRDYDREQCG